MLKEFFYEHEAEFKADVDRIVSDFGSLGSDATKLAEFVQHGRDTRARSRTHPSNSARGRKP